MAKRHRVIINNNCNITNNYFGVGWGRGCVFVCIFCFVKLYSLWYFSNQNQLDGSNNICFIMCLTLDSGDQTLH